MPVYQVPPDAKRFEIVKGKGGDYMIVSETTGGAGVVIPVRDAQQAQEICERLNRGEHGGTIEVKLM
jgi:hypothetical protein